MCAGRKVPINKYWKKAVTPGIHAKSTITGRDTVLGRAAQSPKMTASVSKLAESMSQSALKD